MVAMVRALHLLWALLCGALSVFLASVGGGHPPPIVLVPVVLVAWVLGHLLLWLIVRLARRGREGLRIVPPWPPGVTVALAGLAAVTAVTLFQIVMSVLTGKLYPYRGLELWLAMTGAGLAHAAALVGVLLRRDWGRLLAALVCFGWSGLVAVQTADHVARARPVSLEEGSVALALFAAPGLLGVHLLRSARVRRFFGARSEIPARE